MSMQNSAWQPPVKEKTWRPVWQAAPADDHKYTLRKLDGKKFVVRKADPPYKVKRSASYAIGCFIPLHGTHRRIHPLGGD